jgi:CHAT domain-containing protein
MTFGPRIRKWNPPKGNGELTSQSAGGSNAMSGLLRPMALLIAFSACGEAQQFQAKEVFARALHLADLYNWADAAPAFTEAEQLFVAAGDRRNALYAKLGRIRSNIERDQHTFPSISAQLGDALDDDPLLQNDKELRMFCLIVKGDIDTETNTGAMRQDWEQVMALARDLGDSKWQYRALAQLSMAAFYDADLETARKNIGTALAAATTNRDIGGQIRSLTIIAGALLHTKMYEQSLSYIANANKIAATNPDTGYQFTTQEMRIDALLGLRQLDTAQQAVDELLVRAREARRTGHEAIGITLAAGIEEARNQPRSALAKLDQAKTLGESAGLTRLLADVSARATRIHRESGDLEKAERSAELAAESTQLSGDVWAVPQRLQELAELQVARGRYAEADRVYDRAETFLDAMIGNVSTVLEKTAIVAASSQIYSRHFALIADHFNDPQKAYAIIEQVRGRTAADLLAAGSVAPLEAKRTERAISQLRLKLMAARSTDEVRSLRDQIFMTEQTRWITPGVSILKTRSRETVGLEQIQQALAPSVVLLEYVVADPSSYCLTISRAGTRIVRLEGKARIEPLVTAYLKSVKDKLPALIEARALYDVLLGPIRETAQDRTIVVVRDGQLHLVPFDGLREPSGRFVVENRTVVYSPSATSFDLLVEQRLHPRTAQKALLAIGGVPYSRSPINKSGLARGDDRGSFADLPSSADEVEIAQTAFLKRESKLLLGTSATEAAFKAEKLAEYRVIHLAVHGFADPTFPDRAALVLLSDRSAGEDGFLQASEIVQLHLDADLVVLSACDTAVGPLQGQEGVANLSKAFLLAGARSVISTLWQIDDSSSLFLMRRFYAHLLEKRSPASALTAAKRDMLRTFGQKAVPYQWAAFTIEGAATQPMSSNGSSN